MFREQQAFDEAVSPGWERRMGRKGEKGRLVFSSQEFEKILPLLLLQSRAFLSTAYAVIKIITRK